MEEATIKTTVHLSDDRGLYFHTEAAEVIGRQLELDEGDRIRLAKKMFEAIRQGKIDAYNHRDGKLISLPISLQPLCVRVNNVNQWLRLEGYPFIWDPENPLAQKRSAPNKKTAEERQIERWKVCIDMGLVMPTDSYGPYPRGIGEAAKLIGITRQALRHDLDKYRARFIV